MSVQNAQPLISEARMLTRSSRLSSSPLSLIIWPSSKSLRVSCGDCFVELSLWLMECPPFAQMTFGSGRTGQVLSRPRNADEGFERWPAGELHDERGSV